MMKDLRRFTRLEKTVSARFARQMLDRMLQTRGKPPLLLLRTTVRDRGGNAASSDAIYSYSDYVDYIHTPCRLLVPC